MKRWVSPPRHARSVYRVALDADGNLVSMQVMQPQLIEQRLLYDFVRHEKGFDSHRLHEPAECPR
jgi:hypothetical protein